MIRGTGMVVRMAHLRATSRDAMVWLSLPRLCTIRCRIWAGCDWGGLEAGP